MRNINYLIVHHSACLSTIPKDKLLQSFENTHKERLGKLYGQPISKKSPYKNIAYHAIIFRDGEVVRVRDEQDIGYHASNFKANNEGIGICLAFDLNKESLTPKAQKALGQLLKEYKRRFELKDSNIWFHRDFCRTDKKTNVNLTNPAEFQFVKNCPGVNLTRELMYQILNEAEIPHVLKEKELIKAPWLIPLYKDIEKRGNSLYGYKK